MTIINNINNLPKFKCSLNEFILNVSDKLVAKNKSIIKVVSVQCEFKKND